MKKNECLVKGDRSIAKVMSRIDLKKHLPVTTVRRGAAKGKVELLCRGFWGYWGGFESVDGSRIREEISEGF